MQTIISWWSSLVFTISDITSFSGQELCSYTFLVFSFIPFIQFLLFLKEIWMFIRFWGGMEVPPLCVFYSELSGHGGTGAYFVAIRQPCFPSSLPQLSAEGLARSRRWGGGPAGRGGAWLSTHCHAWHLLGHLSGKRKKTGSQCYDSSELK